MLDTLTNLVTLGQNQHILKKIMLVFLVLLLLCAVLLTYPITLTFNSCVQTENSYIMKSKSYRIKSVIEQHDGVKILVCTKEISKSVMQVSKNS